MAWYSKAIEARPGGRVEGILHKMRGPARPHRFRWGPAPPPAQSELVLTPVEAWIRADLATAIARCRESGALVLMHDYPIDDVRSDVLRAIASENQVPFVDHHLLPAPGRPEKISPRTRTAMTWAMGSWPGT